MLLINAAEGGKGGLLKEKHGKAGMAVRLPCSGAAPQDQAGRDRRVRRGAE